MGRVTITLLAGCLLGTAAMPASTQASSPSPEPDTTASRVELPVYGDSFVVPGDWRADTSRVGVGNGSTLRPSDFRRQFMAYYFEGPGPTIKVANQHCAVEVWSRPACNLGPLDLGSQFGADVEPIALPAGDAVRFDHPHEWTGAPATSYLLTDGRDIYSITCTVLDSETEPPDDAWYSVAASFEFAQRPHWDVPSTGDEDLIEAVRDAWHMQLWADFGVRWPEGLRS